MKKHTNMKKITSTTLAIITLITTTLLFSFGCTTNQKTIDEQSKTIINVSKNSNQIEEQAKAEIQKYFDAINNGKILSHLYKSDILEDRDFLNQMLNIAAINIDEDIFYHFTKTLKSLCEVADKQKENIALHQLLKPLDDEKREDQEHLTALKSVAKTYSEPIGQVAAIVSILTQTKYETLHRYNAFEQIISTIDKPTSELFSYFLTERYNIKSANDFNYTKIDETTVKIELKNPSNEAICSGFTNLTLKKNGEEWEYYDKNNEQIIFKVNQETKDETFKEIASSLYFESVSPEGQIEKARKIQMLTLFDESLAPLKEEMTYEDFELSLSQLMTFIFSAMSSI